MKKSVAKIVFEENMKIEIERSNKNLRKYIAGGIVQGFIALAYFGVVVMNLVDGQWLWAFLNTLVFLLILNV